MLTDKTNLLISIIISIIMVSITGYIIHRIKWKEKNCDKEYYMRKIQICKATSTRPIPMGKTMGVQIYCTKYKDTFIEDFRYKCPDSKQENKQY